MWRNRFQFTCFLLLILMVAGAIISIVADWPAQFGGKGDPDEVASEFFSRGTALAPPFVPLLLFAIFVALARRADRWGTVAVAGTMLLSIVFIVGSLGEAFAEPTPHVPRVVLIASGIIGSLVSALVLVTGSAMLREKGQTERIAVPQVRE
jgi:MFS family permease